MNKFLSPKAQLTLSWIFMAATVVGWPLSAFWFARGEPQVVLGLSWLALFIGAYNTIVTTQINKDMAKAQARMEILERVAAIVRSEHGEAGTCGQAECATCAVLTELAQPV